MSNETPEMVMERLKRLDTRIAAQYSEIHNRYTAFLVTQGFLFTSYALVITRGVGDFAAVWWALVFSLPILGLVSVWMGMKSINAHKAFVNKRLKNLREALEEKGENFGFEKTEAPINTYWHKEGLASTTYPVVVSIFWILCIVTLIISVWPITLNVPSS